MEVQPQAGLGRHGGIGYELVLASAVPQGVWEAETALHAFLKGEKEKEEAKAKEKEKAATRKVTVQAIPEVQGGAPSRVATPQERNSKRTGGGKVPRVIPPRRISERIHEQSVGGPGQATPQRQISERTAEQIIDVPTLHVIPQEPISERIVEQIVEVPRLHDIPRKRISKRIVEQNVDDPGLHGIPQERISERIEGRIGGNPSTSSTAAATLNPTELLGDGDFCTFSPAAKSAKSTLQSSANMLSHSSSWTPEAYEAEQRKIRVDEDVDEYLTSHLGKHWRDRALRGEFDHVEVMDLRGRSTSSLTGASKEAVQ